VFVGPRSVLDAPNFTREALGRAEFFGVSPVFGRVFFGLRDSPVLCAKLTTDDRERPIRRAASA